MSGKIETIWTEGRVVEALSARYCAPAWAFFGSVRNGTGYSRSTVRTADALAFSLYPSRGLDLYGFEVKVSKSDFKAELADPDKAEEIARFCDYWLIAAPAGLIDTANLPSAWGLIETFDNAEPRVKKEPGKLTAKPLDRLMIASILRRASEDLIPKATIQARIDRRVKDAQKSWQENDKTDLISAQKERDHYKDAIAEFEKLSGVKIERWDCGRIAEGVRGFMDFALQRGRVPMDLRDLALNLEKIMLSLREAADLGEKIGVGVSAKAATFEDNGLDSSCESPEEK